MLAGENPRESVTDEFGNCSIHESILIVQQTASENHINNGTFMGSVTPISMENADIVNSKISVEVCPNLTDATTIQDIVITKIMFHICHTF